MHVNEDHAVLAAIDTAFGSCERPEHFTNWLCCDECREHDQLLRSRDRQSLSVEDMKPGWNPLCLISPIGFCYYLPALVRLALQPPSSIGGWFFFELLFILAHSYERNQHLRFCTPSQRKAILDFLRHVAGTREQLVASYRCTKELDHAIASWSSVDLPSTSIKSPP